MPSFGARSLSRLEGVHPDLVAVMQEAIKHFDFSILEGKRTLERQKQLKAEGKSWTLNSKHLVQPDGYVHAVDIIPYPLKSWEDIAAFRAMIKHVQDAANKLNVKIRLGALWSTPDWPHVELVA